MLSQSGRLGGQRISPFLESRGPPQLIPTAVSFTSGCAESICFKVSTILSTAACGPFGVGNFSFHKSST